MSYKDIVVYLDAGPQTRARVRTAAGLAAKFGARLLGVDISATTAFEGRERDSALAIEDTFAELAKDASLDFAYRVADAEAKTAEGFHSHCADLLISAQPHADTRHLANPAVPKDVLLTSGVPMLVLPSGWTGEDPLGRNVVIAWNFGRESTRAMHDAMPILKAAEKVFVYVFSSDYDARNDDVREVIGHLKNHGVNAEADGWRDEGSADVDVTSALFSLLDREDADLIVSGAYGHAPMFEDVFGGASRTLLNNSSMPVLMSH